MVVKAVLNLSEDILKVHVFNRRVIFERFVDDVECKKCSAGVFVPESFDQLGKDECSLIPADHCQEDFGRNFFEVWLVGLQLL
jgi:hypothetical protein